MNCLYSFMSRFWATDGRLPDMVYGTFVVVSVLEVRR